MEGDFGWAQGLLASVFTLPGVFIAFRLLRASDDSRVSTVNENKQLRAERDEASRKYEEQRILKHNWRGFASSLLLERQTVSQVAEMHGCTEVRSLMERLDKSREDNPLMLDLKSLVQDDKE